MATYSSINTFSFKNIIESTDVHRVLVYKSIVWIVIGSIITECPNVTKDNSPQKILKSTSPRWYFGMSLPMLLPKNFMKQKNTTMPTVCLIRLKSQNVTSSVQTSLKQHCIVTHRIENKLMKKMALVLWDSGYLVISLLRASMSFFVTWLCSLFGLLIPRDLMTSRMFKLSPETECCIMSPISSIEFNYF